MLSESIVENLEECLMALDLADNLKNIKEAEEMAQQASDRLTKFCELVPDPQEQGAYEAEARKRLQLAGAQ